MNLTLLRKSANSTREDWCPALYLAVNLVSMVAQGKRLDEHTAAQLLHCAADEDGVLLPVETVLRSVVEFVAQHGDRELAGALDTFADEWERSLVGEGSPA